MPTLYVTEPGSVVRRSGGSVVVAHDEDPDGAGPLPEPRRRLIEVEPHWLERIALVDRVHIASDATHLCLKQGIAVAFANSKGVSFKWALPPSSKKKSNCNRARTPQRGRR